MKKPFCDICEKPASERHLGLSIERAIGEKFETVQTGSTGFRTTRTRITAKVQFGFVDHRTSFGGPPDLCDDCVVSLLQSALDFALVKATTPQVPAANS